MILFSLLFISLFHTGPSQPVGKDPVQISFALEQFQMGKPPLKMYTYTVTLKNLTGNPGYVAIPRWLNTTVALSDKIWGAQYDKFGAVQTNTLFSTSSFTIVYLKGNEQLSLPHFRLEYMGDEFSGKKSILHHILVFSGIQIGPYALAEFMEKDELHYKNLVYTLTSPYDQMAEIPLQ